MTILYFEENKALMHSIFTDDICEISTEDDGYEDLYCVVSPSLKVYIDNQGVACVYGNDSNCCISTYRLPSRRYFSKCT